MTFDERLKFGKTAEKAVLDYLKQYGFDLEYHEVFEEADNRTELRINNLVHGDISIKNVAREKSHRHLGALIPKNLDLDVKATYFVSEKSILGFKGQYYIFFPVRKDGIYVEDAPLAKVVRAKTIERYWQRVPESQRKRGPSGDSGYYFRNIKNHITLEEFAPLLIKIILIHSETSAQFYRDLNFPFTKVLPKGVRQ
jgi:hypothetical protein